MKTIALFTEYLDPVVAMSRKQDHFTAQQELSEEIRRQNGQMVLTGHQSSYQGHGKFSQSWLFVDGQWQEHGPIQVDVIFNKGSLQDDGTVPVFNQAFITELCSDKWQTFSSFPNLSPNTVLIQQPEELERKIETIKTEKIVIKPRDGKEGKDVFIGLKQDITHDGLHYPLIGQEFLDSSGGIPGIVEGLHDFRVAILNGEIVYAYFRTPPQGSYLANVARGGKFEVVPIARIPSQVLNVVEQVEAVMKKCEKRFYGVDVAFTPQGVKIIELNSSLGLLPNKDGNEFKILKEKLAATLLSL